MPDRTGVVSFGDASLSIWEDPGCPVRSDWERQFKRDVFARIVQQLNRLGWTCVVSPEHLEHYPVIARNFRYCRKGDLQAELSLRGRHIKLEMWQDMVGVTHPSGGRYEFGKESRMPYLLRLEMERTRRRIRDYLCAVFDGYTFKPAKPVLGPAGLTAAEWIDAQVRDCWHYKPVLGRREGEDWPYNHRSADGDRVRHGARVWTTDPKGRVITGTAHYNINNMWWVVSGRYGLHNKASFEIHTRSPGDLRVKRNAAARARRLEAELATAIKAMNFERAALLRDILHPCGVPAARAASTAEVPA